MHLRRIDERSGVSIPELSPIEERIVLRVAEGESVEAIAAEVGVAARTIEWHLAQANRKLERASALLDRVRGREHERKGAREAMTNIKTISGLLPAAVAAVVGIVAFGAAQASASSGPIVIPYAKTCDETVGHCVGSAGDGGTLEMQVTSFRATGSAAQLTLTEWITIGDISFTAEMNGHVGPAGFVVLNGTVTEGSFVGAQVHQRSDLVGGDATTTVWTGELQLLPASA
jgi:DNA-binding CsgD family transcriptional regulator